MALDRGITITGTLTQGHVSAVSSSEGEPVSFVLPDDDPASVTPAWGRFLAAAAKRADTGRGFDGRIDTSLPTGGTGLSTSTALTCAALLALRGDGDRLELAKMAKAAEQDATGVQIGIMDQIASLCGVAGSALMIDCHSLEITPVPVPEGLDVLIVHSGQRREIADSAYSERRNACFAAEGDIGPLRCASLAEVETLTDPVIRKCARHVVGDNARVRAMADAFTADDLRLAAQILNEGHRSYAEDFEASTPMIEAVIEQLIVQPGVLAARLTGGGFGGSIVVFAEPGTTPQVSTWWTRTVPSAGARIDWR
jgi:galactokinase